jgi:hypothetical protein
LSFPIGAKHPGRESRQKNKKVFFVLFWIPDVELLRIRLEDDEQNE